MQRKPTALKLLDGTLPKSRQKTDEPDHKPVTSIPPPPKHLSKEEREAWKVFARDVSEMRVLTVRDLAALEMLSCKWALYQHLQKKLKTGNDITYETTNAAGSKMVRTRPELLILNGVEHKLLELMGRFGLTPADRQRVSKIKQVKGQGGGGEDSKPEDEFT